MHLRTLLAVTAAKAALTACHLSGPHIIAPLAADIRRGIIVTCGTNGKTTTNNLLCSMLEAQGYRVVSNRLGANMLEGVAAAFATAAKGPLGYLDAVKRPLGCLDADFACLEVDEASAARVLQDLHPDCMSSTATARSISQ